MGVEQHREYGKKWRDSLAPLALNFPLSVALSVQEHKWSYYMLAKQKLIPEKFNYVFF
jgi:hypothetical protein